MKATNKFLEFAASYDYYPIDSIPERYKLDEWFRKGMDFKQAQYNRIIIPETLKSLLGENVGIFAKIREQFKGNDLHRIHDLYYIDGFYILLYSEESETVVQLMNRDKKTTLWPLYEVINELDRTTSYEQRKPFISQVIEPNKVGVWTAKKLSDWFKYCDDTIDAYSLCVYSMNCKADRNEQTIKDTIKALPNAKVSKHNDYTIIDTPMFCIEFKLWDNATYLAQKVQFKGTIQDIINSQL